MAKGQMRSNKEKKKPKADKNLGQASGRPESQQQEELTVSVPARSARRISREHLRAACL
jgi:hypothetical protein